MKKSVLIIMLLFSGLSLTGQVGINTTTPNALFEIQSSNQATPSNTDGMLIPKIDEFPATNPSAIQDGMLVYITGNGTPAKGFYFWNNSSNNWNELNNGQLQKENSGYVPKGRDESLYGNPGIGALDFSKSYFVSSTLGAIGDFSFAVGVNNTSSGPRSFTTGQVNVASGFDSSAIGFGSRAVQTASFASGRGSIAIGRYSQALGEDAIAGSLGEVAVGMHNLTPGGSSTTFIETDKIFSVGNGEFSIQRSDALSILKNGTITAPSFEIAEITDPKALITKEYLDTPEASTLATLTFSWFPYSTSYTAPGFYKHSGRVYLEGLLFKVGPYIPGEVIFQLPVGYRPASRKLCGGTQNTNTVRVDVLASGEVLYMSGENGVNFLSLEGISFRAN